MKPEIEASTGIEKYLSSCKGIGGRLKKSPDDFIVSEIPLDLYSDPEGEYSLALVRTRNWENNRLIDHLSNVLGIPRREINFAGTKDKRAVSSQVISFRVKPEALQDLELKDIEIEYIHSTNKKLTLGDLSGNSFDITIRDITVSQSESEKIIQEVLETIRNRGGFLNYFGIQRFGAVRPITHAVGKNIIMSDFEKAVMTYVANPIEGENPESYGIRKELEETRNWTKAIFEYSSYFSFERRMLERLVKKNDDFIGAIKSIPLNLQMMFIHSYQSFLFNSIITKRLDMGMDPHKAVVGDIIFPSDSKGHPDRRRPIPVTEYNLAKVQDKIDLGKAFISAPLIGCETEYSLGVPGEIERSIMEGEGVKRKDFFIPDIPRLSSKGTRREIIAPLKNFSHEIYDTYVNMKFDLYKGCYATSLLREFMKSEDVKNYG